MKNRPYEVVVDDLYPQEAEVDAQPEKSDFR
jgi:hypothetical protein